MNPLVIGLDLSLTGTGIAEFNGDTRKLTTNLAGCERLDYIAHEVMESVRRAAAIGKPHAVVENYSFGSPKQASHIGELGGVVKLALWRARVPLLLVTPSQLKKYATGNGNADKYAVRRNAEVRLGKVCWSDDEADALWLRAIGLDVLGMAPAKLPVAHTTALKAVGVFEVKGGRAA